MEINTDTCNRLIFREQERVEYFSSKGDITYPKLRDHGRRKGGKIVRDRGSRQMWQNCVFWAW